MKRAVLLSYVVFAACGDGPAAPMGIVVSLSAPASEEEGRQAGCLSFGSKVGAAFGDLIRSTGELEPANRPMYLQAYPYEGPASVFDLRFVEEETVYGTFLEASVGEDYFVELRTEQLEYGVDLVAAELAGKLYLDEYGLTFSGALSAYTLDPRVEPDTRLSGGVPDTCNGDECNAASVCLLIEAERIEL
jgi:hypothetical protein